MDFWKIIFGLSACFTLYAVPLYRGNYFSVWLVYPCNKTIPWLKKANEHYRQSK